MTTVPNIAKKPLKVLEVPLNKITEEVIPYHKQNLEQYKIAFRKLLANDVDSLRTEVVRKKRTIQHLKDLLYELDTLRAQAEYDDLNAFDEKTLPLRKTILQLVTEYQELQKTALAVITQRQSKTEEVVENVENENPFAFAHQIQIQENIEDLKLREQEQVLENVKKIEEDAEGLRDIYAQLHGMVEQQGEHVEHVETNVETAQNNVNSGVASLIKAHKLKAATYPLLGAACGSVIGGPIGVVAGFKIGLCASIGSGALGYVIGKYAKKFGLKQSTASEITINHPVNNVNNSNQVSVNANDKKDI